MIHHEVVEVSSGAGALDIVRKDTAAFDVIFLDDGMPEMDGSKRFAIFFRSATEIPS
jgi:CheY-like chemotaxis protein